MKNKDIIHCIGDSHASFFSGTDEIQPIWPEKSKDYIPMLKSYRLGPVLAYNLCKLGTTMGGREKLLSILKELQPQSRVMFIFGEIDIRVHLLKQSEARKADIDLIVKECVDRYFYVVMEVKNMGFVMSVFAPMASTLAGSIVEDDYAAYGTCEERNKITKIFNSYLEELCAKENIPVVSLFDYLVDENNLTRTRYYSDRIHLSQIAMPVAVKEIALKLKIRPVLYDNFINKLPLSMQYGIFTIHSYLKYLFNKIKILKNKIKVMLFPFYKKIKDTMQEYRSMMIWIRGGRIVPPPHVAKEFAIRKIARKFGLKTLIETGTFLGEMVEAVKSDFKKIYSIELGEDLYLKAKEKFKNYDHIKILLGDSGMVLGELLKEIDGRALFWLDGHYSAGITAKGDLETPIFQELGAIFGHKIKDHVIIVDDARLFVGKDDFPTMEELRRFVAGKDASLKVEVKDDMIIIHK